MKKYKFYAFYKINSTTKIANVIRVAKGEYEYYDKGLKCWKASSVAMRLVETRARTGSITEEEAFLEMI